MKMLYDAPEILSFFSLKGVPEWGTQRGPRVGVPEWGTQWRRDSVSACGAKGPGFEPLP